MEVVDRLSGRRRSEITTPHRHIGRFAPNPAKSNDKLSVRRRPARVPFYRRHRPHIQY